MTHVVDIRGGESIGDIDNDGSGSVGSVGSDELYRGSADPVLDLLSDSYSDNDRILSR